MFKKMISMVLTAVMVLSCSLVYSFATDTEKVYTFGDIEIVITETNGTQTRASASGSGVASPVAGHSFKLRNGEGNACFVSVDNTDDEADMEVVFEFHVNGENVTVDPYFVEAGLGCNASVSSKSGADLVGSIEITVTADGADSVSYDYFASQYDK